MCSLSLPGRSSPPPSPSPHPAVTPIPGSFISPPGNTNTHLQVWLFLTISAQSVVNVNAMPVGNIRLWALAKDSLVLSACQMVAWSFPKLHLPDPDFHPNPRKMTFLWLPRPSLRILSHFTPPSFLLLEIQPQAGY